VSPKPNTHGAAAKNLQVSKDLVMKLTGISPPIKTEKVQTKKSEVRGAPGAEKTAPPTDRVVLSAGSLEVQKVRDILAQTPEVRADMVQALKEKIANGEYTVDPHRIADNMLSSLLSDSVN
jgi:negative regulator of flagellin synthesis FlgM